MKTTKIFYDCEFLEGTQTKRFLEIPYGKTPPTIDLISIGMVSDDGHEYYAISKDFNLREAWERYQMDAVVPNHPRGGRTEKVYWIRENVLKPIYAELYLKNYQPGENDLWNFDYKTMKRLICKYGKSNEQIATEVQEFCYGFAVKGYPIENTKKIAPNIELYGYYSAYDHVVLCWLFGKMINLPDGFPMYTIDLQQTLEEMAQKKSNEIGTDYSVELYKTYVSYPSQTNEHNALADAKWNKRLHDFIQFIQR